MSRFRCGFRASTGIAAPHPTNHMFKQCEVKQNWFLIFGCNSCAYLFHLTSFTTSSQHRKTITPCPTPSTVCRCVATCFPQCHSIKSACKCVATPLHPTQPLQDSSNAETFNIVIKTLPPGAISHGSAKTRHHHCTLSTVMVHVVACLDYGSLRYWFPLATRVTRGKVSVCGGWPRSKACARSWSYVATSQDHQTRQLGP